MWLALTIDTQVLATQPWPSPVRNAGCQGENMRVHWQGICLSGVALLSLASVCHAQSTVTPEDEYKKLIRVSEEIRPLGENPFGENISLYDGSLSFAQTDVNLAGDGPLLQISRSFHIDGDAQPSSFTNTAFADWTLDLPRIVTTVATQQNVQGWMVQGSQPNALCTQFGPPPVVNGVPGDAYRTAWETYEWWNGYQLVIPGDGSQDLLKKDAISQAQVPQMAGVVFPIVTKRNWAVGCLAQADNDPSREAFLAISPDGTKYWLNHLVTMSAPTIMRPLNHEDPYYLVSRGVGAPLPAPSLIAHGDTLKRQYAAMLVTRIEDRFGNWLTYSYDSDGKLTTIQASDGRKASLIYDGAQVTSVTLQPTTTSPRIWTYQYDAYNSGAGAPSTRVLSRIQLPDATRWTFNLGDFGHKPTLRTAQPGTCDAPSDASSTVAWSGSLSHPSGLTGTFTIKAMKHGRSYVNRLCWGGVSLPAIDGYALIPNVWYGYTATQKVFAGAGLGTQTWSYQYSPANESWLHDCPTSTSCLSTVWTDVIAPDGRAMRYTFSNRFDASESQLLRTDVYSGGTGTSVLRAELNTYADPNTDTVYYYGDDMQSVRVNQAQITTLMPLKQRTVQQEGDSYIWQAEAFNEFAQVTRTKRFSSVAEPWTIQEQTTYLNDVPHWVLGLPLTVKNLTTGEVVSENEYDLSSVTPSKRYRFGQPLMSYTFNSAGQLASFTDGNHHTTSLSNYKRGIPQTISYPDTRTQNLTVDDFGQITSITDQAGSTTSYSYDPVGRLTQISYPSGDEQAWLPKTFTYDPVSSAERGLAAGHWRRTISKGNSRAVTYFDALLRPVLSDSYINGVSGSNTTTLINYDSKGQKTFTSYPNAIQLNFTTDPATALIKGIYSDVDAMGRLHQTRQNSELGLLTTTTDYLSGARMQVTDPKGKVTTISYQVFDQPSYDAVIKVEAPAGVTQAITRDIYGNPTTIRQFGTYNGLSGDVTKTLVYDNYYRLCRTIEPESGNTVMGYDSANNLTWSVSGATLADDGNCHPELAQSTMVTTRSYDAMNRMQTLLPPVGTQTQSTTYTYDPLGNVESATSGLSLWTAHRNKMGQLTGEALQVTGQAVWAIGYAHDPYGSTSLILYPDGESVSYVPDALGRPTRVGSYASGVTYLPDGDVKYFTYGNGAQYWADKNDRNLTRNFTYEQGDMPIVSEDYTYDPNGNITQVDDLANGPRNKVFGYDDLNRLTSAQALGLWGTESYTYDSLNNIRTRVAGSQTLTYNYDPTNRLSSITGGTGSTFVYDIRGNVTNKNGVDLIFDQKNQLQKIPGYGAYEYDAAGRRVAKTPEGGVPTYYFYTQAGQLLYQVNSATTKTTNFIYLGRKLVARNETLPTPIPSVPILAVPGNSTSGSYSVSWSSVSGATSYVLQEHVNAGSWGTVQSGGAASWAASGKGNGTYGYRVQACGVAGCSAWSASGSTTVLLPPTTPASITVPATSTGSIAVSWAASSTATSYTLQQRLDSGSWSSVYTDAATSSTRNVMASGSYTFQVQACNASGCSAYIGSSAVAVTVPPASAPNLSVPGTSGSGSYVVSWSGVSGATSYTLQEQVNGGSWAVVQTSSATSKAISGKSNGTYGYKVQACNVSGCGPWSEIGRVAVVLSPPVPSGLTLTLLAPSNKGRIQVDWIASTGATSYQLQESIGSGAMNNAFTGAATSTILTRGSVPQTYAYQVSACNADACSAWSGVETIDVGS